MCLHFYKQFTLTLLKLEMLCVHVCDRAADERETERRSFLYFGQISDNVIIFSRFVPLRGLKNENKKKSVFLHECVDDESMLADAVVCLCIFTFSIFAFLVLFTLSALHLS